MAYINGNKPIVTDGLVYALDFGNTKSYTSGSNRARSLVFDTATTIVTGSSAIPTLTGQGLNFTSNQWIQRSASLSALDPNGAFTICAVVKTNTSGTLFTQNSSTGNVSGRFQSTSSLSTGFTLSSGDFSRIYSGNFTGSQHITYRYNSGSFDTFINGIPVTASVANAALTGSGLTSTLFINSGSLPFSGSLSSFYVYNRALSADEIYQNFEIASTRYGLPFRAKPYTIDENLYQFLQTTGITDTVTTNALATFISGLKSNGLWNKMVAIYPFVSNTTASLTTNLKEPGIYRLGLTGSFSASAAGLTPSSSTAYIDTIPGNTAYSLVNSQSAHLTVLSYDLPTGNGFLAGNSARAVGGDLIVSSGSRMYHVYRNVGTSSFVMGDPSITNVEVLVVAGGGSGNGGGYTSGGGGAGGLVYSSSFSISPGTSIQTIIGDGGNSGAGQNSVFSTITALGGGQSVSGFGSALPQNNGGSGGGGGSTFNTTSSFGTGSAGQGNNGGFGLRVYDHGAGGGGGAGAPGENAGTTGSRAGKGGDGLYFSQYAGLGLGFPAGWFAGGGGGSNAFANNTAAAGGLGGGGVGARINGNGGVVGEPGKANTGGGGGGIGYGDSISNSSGGSGIVIVSYDLPASALTGSGTGIYLTETAITASVNSQFTSGITGSGNIGLLTVSRTQPATFSIHKNNVSQSVASASLGALPTDIFFNTANLAGSGSLPLQAGISFASIGSGLTTSEVATYHNLISQLQNNLKRQNTLLDNYSGAAAAYSLRRIGPSSYFGSAIRVRRDSDNALRDIGFTSDGQLDTVGLLDFVGVTGSGFVQTWYDQSGNNYNLTQGTTTSQPLVLQSGSIITENKKPTVYFDGNDVLSGTDNPGMRNSQLTVFTVHKSSKSSRSDVINSGDVATFSSNNWIIGADSTRLLEFYGRTPTTSYLVTNANAGNLQKLITMVANNATTTIIFKYNENQILNLTSNTIGTDNTSGVNIGGTTYKMIGNFQELIGYPSIQSTSPIESNINTNYKIYGSATASFDADYSAFITATGITQPTQSAALETLVSDLKSYGLWNKMKAIYPMITDRNNRFAYSEEFDNGQWNKTGTIVTPNASPSPLGTVTGELILETTSSAINFTVVNNGASAYTIDGSDNPTLNLERGKTYNFNINASGHPFYIMTGSGAYTVDGQYNTGVTGQGTQVGTLTFTVPNNAPSTLAYVCQFHGSMAGTINVINNTDSHYIYQTIDQLVTGSEYVASIYGRFLNRPWIAIETNTGAKAWFNIQTGITGSLTGSRSTISNIGSGWYRCALYFTSSVASGPQNIQYHLADADNNLTYTGISGTGSYMWGAQFENGNVLGPYRATTTSGFTTGSMLDQMKYNLRNPVDTDAGFRIQYSGSWNGGYYGNRVAALGTANRGYTNFAPSLLPSNSIALGVYGTVPVESNQYEIGSSTGGVSYTRLFMKYNGNSIYVDLNDGSTTAVGGQGGDGFIMGSRLSNTTKTLYKNTFKSTVTDPVTGNNTSPLYLNENTNRTNFRFVFISEGLTDYEAKALYWIVQKYQTTLGRQVY